jgi:glycosyltransferase involved in cell wall biosynthesis
MPAYNEEAAIADAVKDVILNVFSVIPEVELVVVNDGSRDATGSILDGLASQESRIRVVHQANAGHGPALRAALDAARGDFVLLIDSDRQISLVSFGTLWLQASKCDALLGIRARRQDPQLRLLLTAAVRQALPLLFGARIRDANVPFKILRRSIWLQAAPLIPPDTLAPSLFLAVFLRRGGFTVREATVPHQERKTGVVSIRRWKLLKFCTRAFMQLLAFRGRLARWEQSRAS